MLRRLHLLCLLTAPAVFAQVDLLPIEPSVENAAPMDGTLEKGAFILAPNPASDEVRIIPVETSQERLYALFYDDRGNNRLSIELTGPTVVPLSDMPSGTYMVTSVDSRGTPLSTHRLRVAH